MLDANKIEFSPKATTTFRMRADVFRFAMMMSEELDRRESERKEKLTATGALSEISRQMSIIHDFLSVNRKLSMDFQQMRSRMVHIANFALISEDAMMDNNQ